MKSILLTLLLFAGSVFAQDVPTEPEAPPQQYMEVPEKFRFEEKGQAWTYNNWTAPASLVNACTPTDHNFWSAVGEDGFRYPTWHPATDPKGCHYGHSHGGADPRQSPLWADMGPPLFGFVAQQMLLVADRHMHRGESHPGYKVTWGHRIYTPPFLQTLTAPDLECDLMSIIHMGTFNADAFTNNQHEQHFRVYCTNAETGEFVTRDHVRLMTIAGDPGRFTSTCKPDPADIVYVGPVSPSDSPSTNPLAVGGSTGIRVIPTSECLIKPKWTSSSNSTLEKWQTGSGLRGPADQWVAATATKPAFIKYHDLVVFQAHWYWFANLMSRYYDLRTLTMGKTINACYEKDLAGAFIIGSAQCVQVRRDLPNGPFQGIVCSPFNPFTGNGIQIRVTTLVKNNMVGPEVFYSSIYGQTPSETYFPGSVRQEVSRGKLPSIKSTYVSTKELLNGTDTDKSLCDFN
jgi:hypothetical protein